MKIPFTASVRFHRYILLASIAALFFPLIWAIVLASVRFFSENLLSFDWLIAIDFLWLESIGILLLLWMALTYHRFIRRTLWTLAWMVLLLAWSLIFAAMTQTVEQGYVQWETLDLLATGGLLIAFHITLWTIGSYAIMLWIDVQRHDA